MTQSKSKSNVIVEHEESAADGLRYWTNSTIATLGANFTISMLLQAMKQLIEQVARPDQIERVETVLTQQLAESYDYVRSKGDDSKSDITELYDELAGAEEKEEAELSFVATKSATKKVFH